MAGKCNYSMVSANIFFYFSEPITMPPNATTFDVNRRGEDDELVHDDNMVEIVDGPTKVLTKEETDVEFKPKIIWHNAIAISLFHIIAVATFPFVAFKMKILTHLWSECRANIYLPRKGGIPIHDGVFKFSSIPLWNILRSRCYSRSSPTMVTSCL